MFSRLKRILPQLVKDRLCPPTENYAFLRKYLFFLKTSGLTMFNKLLTRLQLTIIVHLYVEKSK